MKAINAKPVLLKQANLSLVRKVIKNNFTATRAEISEATKISSTTVRSLIREMLESGEIECLGYDESGGGRKAERYRFKPDKYYGAAICINENSIQALLVNVCGEIADTVRLEAPDGDYERAVFAYLDALMKEKEIKAVGVGVPGIVNSVGYMSMDAKTRELKNSELKNNLERRYGLPVVLENDINATAAGFVLRYEHFRDKNIKKNEYEIAGANAAYLHFGVGCVSAGLICDGHIVRGQGNFAGELGLIPLPTGGTLDDSLLAAKTEAEYCARIADLLGFVCGFLNPEYIVLGGTNIKEEYIKVLSDGLKKRLPPDMAAEVLYTHDVWADYCDGMARITAARIFGDLRLVREDT